MCFFVWISLVYTPFLWSFFQLTMGQKPMPYSTILLQQQAVCTYVSLVIYVQISHRCMNTESTFYTRQQLSTHDATKSPSCWWHNIKYILDIYHKYQNFCEHHLGNTEVNIAQCVTEWVVNSSSCKRGPLPGISFCVFSLAVLPLPQKLKNKCLIIVTKLAYKIITFYRCLILSMVSISQWLQNLYVSRCMALQHSSHKAVTTLTHGILIDPWSVPHPTWKCT